MQVELTTSEIDYLLGCIDNSESRLVSQGFDRDDIHQEANVDETLFERLMDHASKSMRQNYGRE